MSDPERRADLDFLRRAVRLAVRGHGGAEPNPMVGCVLVDKSGRVVGEGHHRRCGEAHAEAMALRRAGTQARGATAYVTLEPCNHHGRTPPCSEALRAAGVVRVVYATSDPNPIAAGGAAALAGHGIAVERLACREADLLNEPFLKRVRSGLPWVMAKWAQSIDGKIATRTGDSKWISGERARRMVHRERGRVDAILVGFGTALRDDPQLTARGVRRRRIARRVVVDLDLELPADRQLLERGADGKSTIVITRSEHADTARARGLEPLAWPAGGGWRSVLKALATDHGVTTLLVEGGGGLLGELAAAELLDEAWVFVAPLLLGDEDAVSAVRGLTPLAIADGQRWRLLAVRRRAADALLHFRRR